MFLQLDIHIWTVCQLDLIIENDQEVTTLYSSRDKQFSLSLQNPLFEVALNSHKSVIFKAQVETSHILAAARKEFEEVFANTQRDICFLMY